MSLSQQTSSRRAARRVGPAASAAAMLIGVSGALGCWDAALDREADSRAEVTELVDAGEQSALGAAPDGAPKSGLKSGSEAGARVGRAPGPLDDPGIRGRAAVLEQHRISGAIAVDFVDGTEQSEIDAWETDWGVDLELNSVEGERSGIALAVGVEAVAGILERIRSHPEVEVAEPLYVYETTGFTPDDPDYPRQWNFQMIGMGEAWERTRGEGVTVAVLDSGVAYADHEDFRRAPDLEGIEFVEGYDFVNDDTHALDDHGHGTHVAGTIAQATNNGLGVAGIAFEARLMPVKVMDHFGRGVSTDIADAIRFAADNGAKVINLSLGSSAPSLVMHKAITYAREKGVLVVAAAGNTGFGMVGYPAAFSDVLAVGAVGPDGERAFYSSYGRGLDLMAPGGDLRAGPEGGILQNTLDRKDYTRPVYDALQGTSMAAPHVSGVAALLFSAGAESPEAVAQALVAGATPMGKGWSTNHGHGLLNAPAALAALGDVGPSEWSPFGWAAGLLAAVLLTLKPRERPGYLNVFVRPDFLVSLLLSTVGVFFAQWLAAHLGGSEATATALSRPLPEWWRIVFGRAGPASPLFYSALIPLFVTLVASRWSGLRGIAAGLAIGFAAFLGYAVWSGTPPLAWMPFRFLAAPWLVTHLVLCLLAARWALRRAPATAGAAKAKGAAA